MRVLNLCSADPFSGSGLASILHHSQLIEAGIDSYIYLPSKVDQPGSVRKGFLYPPGNFLRRCEVLLARIIAGTRQRSNFVSTSIIGVLWLSAMLRVKPDVIHYHWGGNGGISLLSLLCIRKPVIITMRDMFVFTGGCHYTGDCEKYLNQCFKCPQRNHPQSLINGFLEQLIKKTVLARSNIYITAISSVVLAQYIQSRIGTSHPNKRVPIIPTSVDTNAFKSLNTFPYVERKITCDKPLRVSIGAYNMNDAYKGASLLPELLSLLEGLPIRIYIFGQVNSINLRSLKNITPLGTLDQRALAKHFSEMDVYISLSTQEAFGKVTLEAVLCGCHAIAFKGTGAEDIITSSNGILVTNSDIPSIKAAILRMIANKEHLRSNRDRISQNAIESFALAKVTRMYVDLYESSLTK
jgi:glycosyltransferase involved in cell wall biosynthesis